jgi:hypothetical protein
MSRLNVEPKLIENPQSIIQWQRSHIQRKTVESSSRFGQFSPHAAGFQWQNMDRNDQHDDSS